MEELTLAELKMCLEGLNYTKNWMQDHLFTEAMEAEQKWNEDATKLRDKLRRMIENIRALQKVNEHIRPSRPSNF